MGSYSIGEALKLVMEKSHWKPKVTEMRMKDEWETITGKTIAKYTRKINLFNKTLTIYTDVAALKQELLMGKEQLIIRINEYFEEKVVEEIVIRVAFGNPLLLLEKPKLFYHFDLHNCTVISCINLYKVHARSYVAEIQ
jgi:hypothetical protein